ncbi:MAG: hypothetical protein AVDCRST_MAG71-3060, partial [uncultured Lysobacter sp.]
CGSFRSFVRDETPLAQSPRARRVTATRRPLTGRASVSTHVDARSSQPARCID